MLNNLIEINLKFIIFLTEINLNKKRFGILGKKMKTRLENKGVYAINFYQWKSFFIKHKLKIPKFDINDESPSHGVVYKKFTDKQYLNIHKFSNYQFQEQSRALTTLVGFLGAKKVKVKLVNKNTSSMHLKNNVNINGEVNVNFNIDHDDRKNESESNIKEFLPLIDEKFFYSSKKFDSCAKNDGLFGVDSEVYTQMKFQNIVSERYNGQLKSYYVIYKELYTKDSIEIGTYINKLNIGIDNSIELIKERTEIYTYVIEYYPIEELKIKNYDRIIKNEILKKTIHKNQYSEKSNSIKNNISDSEGFDSDESFYEPIQQNKLSEDFPKEQKETRTRESPQILLEELEKIEKPPNKETYRYKTNKKTERKSRKSQKSKSYKSYSSPSINDISEYTFDIFSNDKNKNGENILNILVNEDTKINDDEDIKVRKLINECKTSNNTDELKDYVNQCIVKNGLEHDLKKWINKDISNKLEDRCKWFKCKYDIDHFLDKLS